MATVTASRRATRLASGLAVVAALLGAPSPASGAGLSPAVGESIELVDGWQYRWTSLHDDVRRDPWDAAGWRGLTLPERPAAEDDVIWLRTRLPEGRWRDPALRIDAVVGHFEVYLDDERLYVYPAAGINAPGPNGVPWQLVPLPADAPGKLLTLRVRVFFRPGGLRGVPVLGERVEHLAWVVERDTPAWTVGWLLVLIGALVGLGLVRRTDWRAPLGFALVSATLGYGVLYQTFLKDLVLPAPGPWIVGWAAAIPLLFVGLWSFLDEVLGSGPRGLFRRLSQIHVVAAAVLLLTLAVCVALDRSTDVDIQRLAARIFAVPTHGLRLLIAGTFTLALVRIGGLAWRGNRDAQIYALAVAVMAAAAVDGIWASFGLESWRWRSQLHWGALALCLALALILQRRYAALNRRVAVQAADLQLRAREKEVMLRDLHDGVGGLTTNIRMVAELGQRTEGRAQRALASIIDISGRALAELRAFVQTADDRGLSWEQLTAELRRFGATTVESQERGFSMRAQLAAVPAPTALLSLNLFRIFREALTNALKHGTGPVDVELLVEATRVSLCVSHAAAPSSGPGMNTGRGLANMRARAKELGGEVNLEVGGEAGATTRLTVLLPVGL